VRRVKICWLLVRNRRSVGVGFFGMMDWRRSEMIANWMMDVEFLGAIATSLYSTPSHRSTPAHVHLTAASDSVAVLIGAEDRETAVAYGMPR
jgi:hypothetical protein